MPWVYGISKALGLTIPGMVLARADETAAGGFRHAIFTGGVAPRGAAGGICITVRAGRLCRSSAYHAQIGRWVAHPRLAIRAYTAPCAHIAGPLCQRGPAAAGSG